MTKGGPNANKKKISNDISNAPSLSKKFENQKSINSLNLYRKNLKIFSSIVW